MPQAAGLTRGRTSFANGQNFREVGLRQCLSEKKGKVASGCAWPVPSQVPVHRPSAAKPRGSSGRARRFTAETDSLLEEAGFEPSVPRQRQRVMVVGAERGADYRDRR